MAIKHVKAQHYKENIEIKEKNLNDSSLNLSAEQKNIIKKELDELKDRHQKHINFHVKYDEEKIGKMSDGKEKEEATKKLEKFKNDYKSEANPTVNASKKDVNTQSKKANTVSKKDSNTNTKSKATSSETKTDYEKYNDSEYTGMKDTNSSENQETCIKDINALITLYNSEDKSKLKAWSKENKSGDGKLGIAQKNYCEGTKFAEVYGDLTKEMYAFVNEGDRSKEKQIKQKINEIMERYEELSKSIANSDSSGDSSDPSTQEPSSGAESKEDSTSGNVSHTNKEPVKYYYDNKTYKACPEQGFELIKGYGFNYYSDYYSDKTNEKLNSSDKFYTDSTCNTEINKNITKIYKDDSVFKACANQGLILGGSPGFLYYTKAYPKYYDGEEGGYLTPDNTELYTDGKCETQIKIDKEAKTKIYKDGAEFKACANQGLTLSGDTKADNHASIKPHYYDNTYGGNLTADNIEYYTDASCSLLKGQHSDELNTNSTETVDLDNAQ